MEENTHLSLVSVEGELRRKKDSLMIQEEQSRVHFF